MRTLWFPYQRRSYILGWLLILLAWSASPLQAAITNKGTEFWLTFPEGYGSTSTPATLQLLITSETANSGEVQIPGLSFTASFTVAAGATTQIIIPTAAQATMTDGIASLGIHVTAANQISVNGLNYVQYATDGYTGLPVEALGTNYMVVSYENESYGSQQLQGSEFAVVGTQDCTHVTITPRIPVGGHALNVPYTETLNQGDVYQLQDLVVGSGEDLTGTVIGSDKPIAVFGAHVCDFVPTGIPSCNHLVEELWPIPYWGTQFVTMPLATRAGGDTFRFVSSSASTTVTVDGTNLTALQKGWSAEQDYITVPLYITSNNPIYVMQYSEGGSLDTSGTTYIGDPMMVSVPPVNEFDTAYTISTPVTVFSGNYENILTAYPGSVSIDGTAISAASYSSISSSGYSGVQISTGVGAHQLASNQPFGVIAYGFANADAYGYPGGIFFSANTPVPTSTPGGPCFSPTPTATPTPTNTVTATFTRTPTLTPTPTDSMTPTRSMTASPSLTVPATTSPTVSATPTSTLSSTLTSTSTATPTITSTPTVTSTPTPTGSPTPTGTPTWTGSPTSTPTITSSPTWTATPTATDSPTVTGTPTASLTSTLSPTSSLTPTGTSTYTVTLTSTSTDSMTPSATASQTPTASFTLTGTVSRTATPTFTPTFTLTLTPTLSASVTPTFTPLNFSTFTPTISTGCVIHVWPIPFDPRTAVDGLLKISCLPDGSVVNIYTVSGELSRQVAPMNQMAAWDGRNQEGVPVSSGIYFYVIQQGSQVLQEGKLIVLNDR